MTDTAHSKAANAREFIACRIGGKEYCVDIMAVLEIRGWTQGTKLPHAPNFVCGVINLRGAVLPVIDLASRLGIGTTTPGARHVIIIAKLKTRILGLLVDAVSDILSITDDELQQTPDVASETAREFVSGLLMVEDRMIRVLTLDPLASETVAETA